MAAAVLILITIFGMIAVICVSPFIKKATNNWFFWIIGGSLLFVYVTIFRFGPDWVLFALDTNRVGDSIVVSKALLLDICPFCCFSIILLPIFDPSRKIAKVVAPFAIFGGLLTIVTLPMTNGIEPELTIQFVLIGEAPNKMYFMIHFINVIWGTLVFCSVSKTKWSDWIYCNLFAILYYSYVAIFMTIYDVQQNVSGLREYDWVFGEYSGVGQFLSVGFPWCAIIALIFCYSVISLIIFAQNRLQHIKIFRWYNIKQKNMFDRFVIGYYQLHPAKEEVEQETLFGKLVKPLRKKK